MFLYSLLGNNKPEIKFFVSITANITLKMHTKSNRMIKKKKKKKKMKTFAKKYLEKR